MEQHRITPIINKFFNYEQLKYQNKQKILHKKNGDGSYWGLWIRHDQQGHS